MPSDESTSQDPIQVWFDRAREHFYAIPKDAELTEGELKLHSLRGQIWRVRPADVAAWEISREAATAWLDEHINAAWGEMRGAWSKLLDMGHKTAGAAGVNLPGEGRPELPEDLASLLGIQPGELLTEPGLIRSKIRRAMFGEDDGTDEPETAPAEPAVEPEPLEATPEPDEPGDPEEPANGVDEPPPEVRLEDLAKKAEQAMRGVFKSPEFGAAVAGFGDALRRAGQKLQQAAEGLEE